MYGIMSLQRRNKKCSNGTHKCEKRPTSPKTSMKSLSWIFTPHILTMIMYLLFNVTVNHRTRNQISVHLIEKLNHFFITRQSIV
ncbi:hypothetical protein ERO13_A11G308533v2 [Gossypium hirsutum]|nr:hypothetical protein ERO13_A11G308533v2 [Gossypium hirsutum]